MCDWDSFNSFSLISRLHFPPSFSNHWPTPYWLFCSDESVNLFFVGWEEIQGVWKVIFKMKMWDTCTVACFLVPAGVALGLLSYWGECFQSCRHRRMVNISGRGTGRMLAPLVEVSQHFYMKASFQLWHSTHHMFNSATATRLEH